MFNTSSASEYILYRLATYMLTNTYCLGLFVVVYSKQCCLQTNKYDQSLRVLDIYILTKFHYYNYVISFFLGYASSI